MIDHVHKLIFLHIPKTGGTSITAALMGSNINSKNETEEKHWDANRCRDEYNEFWDNYMKFTVVRNPWSRMYSFYNYFKNVETRSDVYGSDMSFKDWLISALGGKIAEPWGGFGSQIDFISCNGKVQVDHILKFENLESDFNKLCKKLLISKELPHYNGPFKTSNVASRNYTKYYDEDSINLVAKVFEKDIKYFGYTFEDVGSNF